MLPNERVGAAFFEMFFSKDTHPFLCPRSSPTARPFLRGNSFLLRQSALRSNGVASVHSFCVGTVRQWRCQMVKMSLVSWLRRKNMHTSPLSLSLSPINHPGGAGGVAHHAVRRRPDRGVLLQQAVVGAAEVPADRAAHHGVVRAAAARQEDGNVAPEGEPGLSPKNQASSRHAAVYACTVVTRRSTTCYCRRQQHRYRRKCSPSNPHQRPAAGRTTPFQLLLLQPRCLRMLPPPLAAKPVARWHTTHTAVPSLVIALIHASLLHIYRLTPADLSYHSHLRLARCTHNPLSLTDRCPPPLALAAPCRRWPQHVAEAMNEDRAQELRQILAGSGSVTFIKSGQALSLRGDLVKNREYVRELTKLQVRGGVFPTLPSAGIKLPVLPHWLPVGRFFFPSLAQFNSLEPATPPSW